MQKACKLTPCLRHAGYEYSGECAAWAYAHLDVNVRRIFVLGPSHVARISHCAASTYDAYDTPFGPLVVDHATIEELEHDAGLKLLDRRADMREHSLELQMPYIRFLLDHHVNGPLPKIVPLVVGNLTAKAEKELGKALAPWLRSPSNAFIISSDFCHWGLNFDYAPYSPTGRLHDLALLKPGQKLTDASVEDTIEAMDMHAISAICDGSHNGFRESLALTKNTVCGRHPIGVILAAMEEAARLEQAAGKNVDYDRFRFKLTQYMTSGRAKPPISDCDGHSVSYAAAYAVL